MEGKIRLAEMFEQSQVRGNGRSLGVICANHPREADGGLRNKEREARLAYHLSLHPRKADGDGKLEREKGSSPAMIAFQIYIGLTPLCGLKSCHCA